MSDAYMNRDGGLIRLGTGRIAMTLELTPEGKYLLTGLTNSATGKQYIQSAPTPSDEFSITVNGETVSGLSGGFTLEGVTTSTRSQGELETVVTLARGSLKVARHYIAYPGLPVIQSFTEYTNLSSSPMTVSRPSLFVSRPLGEAQAIDFSYMTGGANFTGSQIFKTVPAPEGFLKEFDSQGQPEIIRVDGVEGNTWHPRMNGCAVWNEFFSLKQADEGEGLWLTFDYQGWWKASMSRCDGRLALIGWCELIDYDLPAGDTLKIAPMTIGLYQGDYDDLGNAIQEYVYTYKWDYTRDKYFDRTNLSIWRAAPLTDKVFRMVEAARYVGVERIWVDDFWFDAKGNWKGIFGDDWKHINDYIRENGMLFRLWMPPWHADRLSKVWLDHPDWMLDFHGNWYNWTIDMSREEAYQWILTMLCDKQKEFGTYDLRVDGDPCNLKNNRSFNTDNQGNWNCTLKQSENFYRLYREFKDKNPDAGLDGCSSGGHTLGIESSRYTDQQQITDGYCFHMGGYYTTMLLPIDKHQSMPISGAKGGWDTHTPASLNLFSAPGLGMQDPEIPVPPEVLEGRRKDLELFYFLRMQGVYGRWIKVFRPALEHHDPTFILQRMTWDLGKGLVMISANDLNPLLGKSDRLFIKGLDPARDYLIESRLGSVPAQRRRGDEWMRDGVFLASVQPGEVLFINLPDRPGTGSIDHAPDAPTGLTVKQESWLGRSGTGVRWTPPTDRRLISYYELAKNGAPFTKISTGAYYFDVCGDASARYAVRSVDFDGNASPWTE